MTEQEIRMVAYALWEEAGRPDGRDKEFWSAAERQLAKRDDLDLSEQAKDLNQPPVQAGLPVH